MPCLLGKNTPAYLAQALKRLLYMISDGNQQLNRINCYYQHFELIFLQWKLSSLELKTRSKQSFYQYTAFFLLCYHNQSIHAWANFSWLGKTRAKFSTIEDDVNMACTYHTVPTNFTSLKVENSTQTTFRFCHYRTPWSTVEQVTAPKIWDYLLLASVIFIEW